MSEFKDVVIVSGVRLPVGSFGGSLKTVSAIDMGAMVVKEAVNRAGIQPSDVNEVIVGQVGEIAQDGFVARAVSLKAGMPKECTAYSVNRQCGSSLQAIADAAQYHAVYWATEPKEEGEPASWAPFCPSALAPEEIGLWRRGVIRFGDREVNETYARQPELLGCMW